MKKQEFTHSDSVASIIFWLVVMGLVVFGIVRNAHAQTPICSTCANFNWGAPTTHSDGTPITGTLTYTLYSGAAGAVKTKVEKSGILTTSIALNQFAAGKLCFDVTATEGGQESDHSAEACKTFLAPKPAAPGSFTVQ